MEEHFSGVKAALLYGHNRCVLQLSNGYLGIHPVCQRRMEVQQPAVPLAVC